VVGWVRDMEVKADPSDVARAACPDESGSRPLWHGRPKL
jgi:hypothetical protein